MLSTPRWTRPIGGLTAALAAAMTTLVWAPAGQAEVAAAPAVTAALDQVADGAEVVVVVPSLSGLNEAIAEFGAATGLDRFGPELDDAVGAFKQQMGWQEGVDDDGAALVVLTGVAEAITDAIDGGGQEPEAILLVPVTDHKAFVSQLGGDPAADVSRITMMGEGFAKELNGYAVLGENLETVQGYAAGDNGKAITDELGPMVAEYLNGGESLIYVDVAAMAEPLNAAIDKMRNEMAAQMNNPGVPASMQGMIEGFVDLYEDWARTAVDGTDKLLLSLDFGDDGLGMTISSKLIGGSELTKVFTPAEDAGDGSASSALLAALPDQPYIYASAIDANRFGLGAMVDKIAEAMGGDKAGFMATFLESIDAIKGVNGVASVFYTPDPAAMMAGGFYTSLTVYDTDDAASYLAQQKANFEKLNDLKVPLPAAEPGQPDQEMTFTSTYTEKALVIDDIDVHQYQVTTVLPPAMMQQFGPMAMMMGNSGSSGYIAAKDGKVLVTTVPDPQLITNGLRAVDQNGGVGSAGNIATLRESSLPADSSLELYVSVAGIANTVNPFLLMFSPNGEQLDVPADLSPLAMGGASDGEAVAMKMFVPHDLVKFGVETYEKFAPAAPGQGGNGSNRPPRAF
ncbi:MAG: hypothetical protein AAGH99_11840 [Planctomycetota bacterium]